MHKQKKIKIAIATHEMVTGGIEKSLLELIKVLKHNNYEVTVFVEGVGGELLNNLTSMVPVINIFENFSNTFSIVKQSLKKKKIKKAVSAINVLFANWFNADPVRAWEATTEYLDGFTEEYDYAFAYGAPVSFSVIFVDRVIRAKKKYTWVHNDVSKISLDIQKYRRIFNNYDKIICVSKKAKETFSRLLPECNERTMIFYNILDKEEILKMSEDTICEDTFEGIKLLTVGRISYEKAQDIIPLIAKKLVSRGYNIRWYCVGEGEERPNLEKQISDLKMESRVILVGNQKNPYPFFRMADLYVQPSRHEGFCITISEAKIFELAIITTDFDGADEQITDGKTGFIVPFDEEIIYQRIVELLENMKIKKIFLHNLKKDKQSCKTLLNDLFS